MSTTNKQRSNYFETFKTFYRRGQFMFENNFALEYASNNIYKKSVI